MLDALFDDQIDSLVRLADESSRIEDTGEAIRGFLFGLMEKRATDRVLEAILTMPGQSARFAEELSQNLAPAVNQLVDRAIHAGELRPDLTGQEVCLLSFMVGKVADITRDIDPDAWRRYAQLLIDGTRPSAATKPLSPPPLSLIDVAMALGRTR